MSALAVTMGEPAGIGPEIALQAWMHRKSRGLPPFFLIADPDHIAHLAERLGYAVPVVVTEPERAAEMFPLALPILPLDMAVIAEPGQPNAADAPAVIEAIRRGVELVHQKRAAALVTNPISKAPLMRAGFPHPGHTEFLGALAEQNTGQSAFPVMMLWSEELAVVPVTVHIPLADVPAALTKERLLETARIVARDLRERFGIHTPRLAVAGLNPHAGEDGELGHEDDDVIRPAIAELRAEGLSVSGPLPADTMFHADARAGYDAALAMYHDQALIPIKTLAFDRAVNVTLGLPFVRTSPDHGTAFGIAGTGKASPASLIAAIRLAARLGGLPDGPAA